MRGWTSCLIADSVAEVLDAFGSWIKNEEGDYLFCIQLHCPFRHPLNTLVIGQCPELDMTHFVCGEEWTRCREPILAIPGDKGEAAVLASEPNPASLEPVVRVISVK